MIVMKFGGTSVGSAGRIIKSAEIIKSRIHLKPVVVVSAVAKITDDLIKLAKESADGNSEHFNQIKNAHLEIINQLELEESLLEQDFQELSKLVKSTEQNKNINLEVLDNFQSFGEKMSSKIVAAYLNQIGIISKAYNSWDLGLLTTNDFGNAEPLESGYTNIKNNILKLKLVPVITGFIGKTKNNKITTFGRGGSDYSAVIFGSAIDADEIQIWTDVDGVMTADPKIVQNPKPVRQVSFAEASELAYFGAKVLHPKSILPAMRKNIPVRVLNSFNPQDDGTKIVNKSEISRKTIKSIAYKNNTTLIHIDSTRMLGAYGFLARIFYIFGKYKKSVDVVSTSEVSVSLTVDNGENVENILRELKEFSHVETAKNKSIICVVGEGIKDEKRMAGRIFTTLGKNNINVEMISQGASKINLTFVVDGNDTSKAVMSLHDEYFG